MKKVKTVAIMRPSRYAEESVRLTESLGFEPIVAPMIEAEVNPSCDISAVTQRIQQGKSDVPHYVIFTSANGIDFASQLGGDGFIRLLSDSDVSVCAIGENTKKALEAYGIGVSHMPSKYTSDGLVEMFRDITGGQTDAVVDIMRSSHGAPVLVSGLSEMGATVYDTAVYNIIRPDDGSQRELVREAAAGNIDIFPFTSTMMVRNFFWFADEMGLTGQITELINREKIICAIGAPTANTLLSFKVNVDIIPENCVFEQMLADVKRQLIS